MHETGKDSAANGRRPATAGAVLIIVVAVAVVFSGLWRAGISDVVGRSKLDPRGGQLGADWQVYNDADAILAAWLVTRNAHTLTTRPGRLFETEHCAPAPTALAFGEPMITLGALAIPGSRLTTSPVTTYNIALLALYFLSALAMYLLIADWTGSAGAAIAAALLYAFNAERIADLAHSFIYDTTWIVLAMYFARRWLARGRWRDALALALCGALQLGTSVYPILASLIVAVPVGLGLLRAHGLPRARVPQLAAVVAVVLVVAYLVFSPYLEVQATHESLRRSLQYFAGWGWFVPHREAGIAWAALALAAVALLLPRHLLAETGAFAGRTPRGWIALGAVAALCTATGPNQPATWQTLWHGAPPFGTPDVYAILARLIPGLDAVRVPARVDTGYHLGLCVLAGLGAAALIERAGRFRTAASLAIVMLVAAETWMLVDPVRPAAAHGSLLDVAPPAEDVELYATLARLGDTGPLLELPIGDADREYLFRSPRRILLAAYHGRRTSACYASFLPPGRDELRHETLSLPDPAAIERVCALGFTTAIVHLDTPLGRHMAERFQQAAARGTVRYLAANGSMSAFGMCDPREANDAG